MKKISNAKTYPQRFFGLHMVPGVANYREEGVVVYVSRDAAHKMDPTYAGKPVFALDHIHDVAIEDLENEADGYVIRSFYNKSDGNHWTEFLAITDKALDAIKRGFKLSNSYGLTEEDVGAGGVWHDVDYQQEILGGVYDHLAIVDNPRYEESVILTPEQFKQYNDELDSKLLKIANDKKESTFMSGLKDLKFFKKTSVDNSKDLEGMMVTLPKSKIEMPLLNIINAMDEAEVKKGEKKVANATDTFMVGEEEMTVGDMASKYAALKADADKIAADAAALADDVGDLEDEDLDEDGIVDDEDMDLERELSNESDEDKDKDKDKDKKAADKKSNAKSAAEIKKIKNAREKALRESADVSFETPMTQVARGASRYGSSK